MLDALYLSEHEYDGKDVLGLVYLVEHSIFVSIQLVVVEDAQLARLLTNRVAKWGGNKLFFDDIYDGNNFCQGGFSTQLDCQVMNLVFDAL